MNSTRALALVALVLSACVSQDVRSGGPDFDDLDGVLLTDAGVPYSATGDLGSFQVSSLTTSLQQFREDFGAWFQMAEGASLHLEAIDSGPSGSSYIHLSERLEGLEVVQGRVILGVDGQGRISSLECNLPPTQGLQTDPQVTGEAALEMARRTLFYLRSAESLEDPELVIFIDSGDRGQLAWRHKVRYLDVNQAEFIETLYSDALTGVLLSTVPSRQDFAFINRIRNQTISGSVITSNGITSDEHAALAYQNMARTWAFYEIIYGRGAYFFDRNPSVVPINNVAVHSDVTLNAAYWNRGWQGWEFTHGDGELVEEVGFVDSFDVMVHEYTHAVIEYTAGLIFNAESGAINESLGDIMGARASVYDNPPHGSGDHDPWLVGESVWTPGIEDDAIRYLNDPVQDSGTWTHIDLEFYSRDFYPDRVDTTPPCIQINDYCGVHFNSGISNLAFFLLSEGGVHPQAKSTIEVPGIGIDLAAEIFYGAMHHRLLPNDGFSELRRKTVMEAQALHGNGFIKSAVCAAWDAVGVPPLVPDECEVIGVPTSAPTGLGHLRSADLYDLVWWDEVENATRYEVQTALDAAGPFVFEAGNVIGKPWATLTDSLGEPFYARVRACNANGCGPFSPVRFLP